MLFVKKAEVEDEVEAEVEAEVEDKNCSISCPPPLPFSQRGLRKN